jgi:hypothetical protein
METSSRNRRITDREIYYFRQRQKNLIFQSVIAFFAQRAERFGLTKSALADSLGKDRSQITRWMSGPSNMELDSISDFLLGMGAEMRHEIVSLNEPDVRTENAASPILPPIEYKRPKPLAARTESVIRKVASS